MSKQLAIGNKAPDFTLINQDEQEVSLAQFRGKKVLIYFYPKALTSGCTTQSCAVRDAVNDIPVIKDIVALGISPDEPAKQRKFIEKNELNFQLLCDTEHKIAEAFGVWGEKSMYGKKYFGIIRSSFLIDEKGKLIGVWYKVKPNDTVPKALEVLNG
jgi:peroxiredoxin Q/BCP